MINRPYSQTELNFYVNRIKRKLNIGVTEIKHPDCGHSYYAKINGIKERTALLSDFQVLGKCSVCWRLNKEGINTVVQGTGVDNTVVQGTVLQGMVVQGTIIHEYNKVVEKDFLEYSDIGTIEKYYRWLYGKNKNCII